MWGRERELRNVEIFFIWGGIFELFEEVLFVIVCEKFDLEYLERKLIKFRVENGEVFVIINVFSKRVLGNMKCLEEIEDFKSFFLIV